MSRHCSHGIFLRIRQRGLLGKQTKLLDEFAGKWDNDLVYMRPLVLVLLGFDTEPVLRHLYQLFKPGGTLQWDDLDCVNMRVEKVDLLQADVLIPWDPNCINRITSLL
ncbi:hypothetical protein DPV78_008222 [Talaromyces pinophilus]|nr:hypothetical protein DPV78_008222 [Talaromyces pinophilus]